MKSKHTKDAHVPSARPYDALTPQNLVDLRDLRAELESAKNATAGTPEQRALKLMAQHLDPDTRPRGILVDGSVIPGGRPHGGGDGPRWTHETTHVSPTPAHVDPCADMQAVSTPRERDFTPWSNWGIADAFTLQTGSCCVPKMFSPKTQYEISSAIRHAEADGQTIRALGSGWSFSDAALPQQSAVPPSLRIDLSNGAPTVAPFFGYAVKPDCMGNNLQHYLPLILRADVNPSSFFFVEAGITLHELNDLLNSQVPPKALRTMGGSDGQTLGGLLATGAHGSDYDRPPLADNVLAIYLVGAGGVHHWIERQSRQITDAAKVHAAFPCIAVENVHYRDDMFNAAVVSMGAMGVTYAVVLEVVEQYVLMQFNVWSTWEALITQNEQNLFDGLENGDPLDVSFLGGQALPGARRFSSDLDQFFSSHQWLDFPVARSFQVLINPIRNDNGSHNCYATVRFEFPLRSVPASLRVPSGVQPSGFPTVDQMLLALFESPDIRTALLQLPLTLPAQLQQLANALTASGSPLWVSGNPNGATPTQMALFAIDLFQQWGYDWAVRAIVDLGYQKHAPLTQTVPLPFPQVDLGFRIMTGGTSTGTGFPPGTSSSLEAAFPLAQAIQYVNSLTRFFDGWVDQRKYPAGYLSLRTCGRTSALMGIEQFGREGGSQLVSESTGAVELALLGNANNFEMIRIAEDMALDQRGLLHWGQSNGHMAAVHVAQGYQNLGVWMGMQRALGGNTFTNMFMKRLGLA